MPFLFYNPTYWLFALPALLLGLYAQFRVQTSFNKYMRVPNYRRVTGLAAARELLSAAGLGHVEIEGTAGTLSDHYDPRTKTLRLSRPVAQSASVAAVAVVAHEVGHAVQDATDYTPMRVRSGIVPLVNLGSWLGPILFFIGLLAASPELALIGVLGFAAAAVFALVTLPVELNASSRALHMLQSSGLIAGQEVPAARTVLNAAALTYVAALAQAISTLLYFLTLLGGVRRD
ncbi:MAG: zinc metallopeptidase [Anaerolineae bacterium]|nr:zinc metallopeptidase [Anaerolineae bacterium]